MSNKRITKFYLYSSGSAKQLVSTDDNGGNICCWQAPKGKKDGFWFVPSWSDGIYLVVHSEVITETGAIVHITEQYEQIGGPVKRQFILDKLYEQPKTGN